MDKVTDLLINMYNIKKIGIDFMGYTFVNSSELSYHHLLVPQKEGGEKTVENGVILVRRTAHDYLHLIEKTNKAFFRKITEEIKDEKNKGKIDIENIKRINDILLSFENKYEDETNKDGKLLIKEIYKSRFLTL